MEIIIGIICLIIGILIGYFLLRKILLIEAKEKADLIVKKAELQVANMKKDKLFEIKEKYQKIKSDFESKSNKIKNQQLDRKNKLEIFQNKLKQRERKLHNEEEQIKKEKEDLEKKQKITEQKSAIIKKKKEEFEKIHQEQILRLEKISLLSKEEAIEELKKSIEYEAHTKAFMHIKKIKEEANIKAAKEAKRILITTIQRTSSEHTIENCISVFNFEDDQIKGKIIGREGRNIKALEATTGTEIIVDETPGAVVISSFDPVRREIAKIALRKLIEDGRIHPARIEEVVEKTCRSIEDEIIEIGERTVTNLNIHGLHPELIKLVGRMRFRSSYGQNLLQHAREVAKLCSILSAELSLNYKLAKRAGLLHDIGKVSTEEPDLPHAILGMKIAQKYDECPEICNAIGAHHDEIEMEYLISPIIQACDSISGSRPGARREMVESYIKRIKDMEDLALSFEEVKKCYAMQAGRELRIIVDAENISDVQTNNLSFEISQKIEKEMQYPGQIKITVIREMRAVSYAK